MTRVSAVELFFGSEYFAPRPLSLEIPLSFPVHTFRLYTRSRKTNIEVVYLHLGA